MKAIGIILCILSWSLAGYSQSEGSIPEQQIPSTQPESIMKLRNAPNPYQHQYNQNFEDMCVRYKAVETGGIVLSVLGGGLIITGAALLPHIHASSGEVTEYSQNINNRQRTAAKAAIAVGSLSMIAGIPMITFGALKARKACGPAGSARPRAALHLQTDENGAGLALKF